MGKHKNSVQEKVFLEFMEAHHDLAKNFVKGDRINADSLWAELTNKLNSEGPPQKDINGWKKIWSDWKGTIRKKISHNKCETRGTGGGPFNQFVISPTEDAIAKICGIYTSVDGISDSTSFGAPKPTSFEATEELEETMNIILSSSDVDGMAGPSNVDETAGPSNVDDTAGPSNVGSQPPQKRIRYELMQDCMKKHMSTEATAVKNISETMNLVLENSKESVKILGENRSSIKRVYRSLEKLVDVVTQQNALSAEQNELRRSHYAKMEKLVQAKNQIKIEMLEVEKEKLKMEMKKIHQIYNMRYGYTAARSSYSKN